MVANHPYIRAAQRKNGSAAAKLHVEFNEKMHHPASKDSRSGRSQPKGWIMAGMMGEERREIEKAGSRQCII